MLDEWVSKSMNEKNYKLLVSFLDKKNCFSGQESEKKQKLSYKKWKK